MKASELIQALQDAIGEHGDLEVETEGCDCLGTASGVVYDNAGPQEEWLLITRGGGALSRYYPSPLTDDELLPGVPQELRP